MRFVVLFVLSIWAARGWAQQNYTFAHTTSNLVHINPAAAGLDSVLNLSVVLREQGKGISSQSVAFDMLHRPMDAGLFVEYFGYEYDFKKFDQLKVGFSKHGLLSDEIQYHFGAGLTGVQRTRMPKVPGVIGTQSDPEYAAQVSLGAMIFYQGLEAGVAHHEYVLAFNERETLPFSTTHIHFGWFKSMGEMTIFPNVVVSSGQVGHRALQVALPIQYKMVKAGVAFESGNIGWMLGVQVSRLTLSLYHNQRGAYTMDRPANEVHISFSISESRAIIKDLRRQALF